MRKIKEVLRLKWAQGLSNRRIAKACGIGRPTVSEYLRRAADLSSRCREKLWLWVARSDWSDVIVSA